MHCSLDSVKYCGIFKERKKNIFLMSALEFKKVVLGHCLTVDRKPLSNLNAKGNLSTVV